MRNLYLILFMTCSLSLVAHNTYSAPESGGLEINDCNGSRYDANEPNNPYTKNNKASVSCEAINCDPENLAFANGISMPLHGLETSTLCNGVLYDNGGIDGNYAEGSNSQFLIAPTGATSITVTFTAFDLGSAADNNDLLALYGIDGSDYTPLATYLGNDLPNNGQPITFETPALALFFYSDHEGNFLGFEMIWEANGSANPPTAAFTADAATVPFGTAIQFTDTSSENPGAWSWDFGDGTTSDEQNPSHVYTESGTYGVTLIVTNCNSSDTSEVLEITVQEPPAITYDPDSFLLELDAGTSTTDTLNLCNVGQGDLTASLSSQSTEEQIGYILDFNTSAEGDGVSWQLLDEDFAVIAENSQPYVANTDYSETIIGLEADKEYYFQVTGFPEGTAVFESITITDLGTGEVLFSGAFEFLPDQLYIFPTPQYGEGGAPAWLSIGENSSPLSASACEGVGLTFDATELVEGTYQGSITIESNDPDNPSITIPVTLVVNGTPALSISANDLDFGEVQVGGTANLSFILENTGTAPTSVSGLQSSLADFSVQSADSLLLDPYTARAISVDFAPSELGAFAETLTLANNAGDDLLVNLSGTGVAAPSLTVNPTEFTVELIEGQDTSLTVDVGNVGEAPLDFIANSLSSGAAFAGISPTSGTVAIDTSTSLLIDLDATGLATGVYDLVYELETNDPLQPLVPIDVTLSVIAPVTAAIEAPDFVCGTLPIQFTDASTNLPTSWNWDFGDGTTSTEQNPVHTYAESGTYTITLEACNTLGCDTVTLTDFLEVDLDCFSQNIPQHGSETITVCSGDLYDSGGPDAPYLEGSFGSVTIAPPGATSVSITFSEFNYQEHADFVSVYDGTLNDGTLLGTFTGNDLQGQTLTATSGVLTVQEHTDHFTNLSGFSATFNCSASPPEPPKPLFSIASTELCANEPAVFTDESLEFPTSWLWEFGDGGTSNEQNPVYFYSDGGTYAVSLTVCNSLGCNTRVQEITITIDPDCVLENMPVNGQQLISGCLGSLYDSGGPDSNYVDDNASLTTIYSLAGPITLEFVSFSFESGVDGVAIFDGATINDPLLGYFTGTDLPEAITSTGSVITIVEFSDAVGNDVGFQINYSCQGASNSLVGSQIRIANEEMCDGIRSFGASASADVESWSWDFGDGHTSTEANPEHTFSHSGVHDIRLTICNAEGCETLQTAIYSNKLTPEIMAPDTVALGQEVQLQGLTPEATHWSWDFGNGQTADHATPVTAYSEAGWHDIDVHLINMDVHETCDANHTHSIFVDANLNSTQDIALLDFTVFPNPTSGQLNLRGLETADERYEIRLRSMVGQVVRAMPLVPTVSLDGLPSGMYLLEIVDGKQVVGRKRAIKE